MSSTILGALQIRLSADTSNFDKSLDRVNRSLRRVGKSVSDVGQSMSKSITAPILAVGAATTALAISAGNTADRLLDLSDITNLSTDALQEYQYVANVAGVETEAVSKAAEGLIRKLGDTSSEGGKVTKTLQQLGISVKDANGNMKSGESIMDSTITRLADMENVVERNAIGSQIFGGAWKDMAPILAMGSDGIAKAREEAQRLGLVMSKEALEGANKFRQSVDRLNAQFKGLWLSLGMKLAPVLDNVIIPLIEQHLIPTFKKFTDFLAKVVEWFGRLTPAAQRFSLVAAGVAAAIGPVLVGLGFLATTILPALIAGFGTLFSPITLIIGAIAAVAAGAIYLYDNWDTTIERIKVLFAKMFNYIVDHFGKLYGKIGDLLAKAGFEDNIFQKAAAGADKLKKAVPPITREFKSFGDSVKNVTKQAMDALGLLEDKAGSTAQTMKKAASTVGTAYLVPNSEVKTAEGVGFQAFEIPEIKIPEIDTSNIDVLSKKLEGVKEQTIEIGSAIQSSVAGIGESIGDAFNAVTNSSRALEEQQRLLKDAQVERDNATTKSAVENADKRIEAIQKEIDKLNDLGKSGGSYLALETFLNGMVGVVGQFLGTLGQQLVAAGVASEAFKKLAVTGVPAIAAGIALISLSKVVGNSMNKNPMGGAGSISNGGSSRPAAGLERKETPFVVQGDWKASGTELQLVLKNQERRSRRVGG